MSRLASDWPLTPRRRETTGGSNTSSSVQRHHHRQHSHQTSGIWAKQQYAGPAGTNSESIGYKLEWRIDEVIELAEHVEGIGRDGAGERKAGDMHEGREEESPSEVLRAGRSTVDGMYKFDLGVTTEHEGTEHEDRSTRRLTFFICCVALDVPSFTTDLFIGITTTTPLSGREYGSTPYLWSHSQTFTFRPNDDFVKIPLPVLSTLAENAIIKASNAFTLCIRIDETYGSNPMFQLAGQVSVPTDLMAALGSMIDVPAGADVRFVCLEHMLAPEDDRRTSSGSYTAGTTSRKRVLYANSQILGGRSAYFADLFKGDFSESKLGGNDAYKTVMVGSADFDTVYWMLRFVYTNELLFDEKNDRVRDLLRQQSIDDATVHQLLNTPSISSHQMDEWGWHPSGRDDESSADADSHSITSSVHSTTLSVPPSTTLRSPTASSVAKSASISPRSKQPPTSATSRSSSGSSYPSSRTVGKGPHPTRGLEPDPHPHPCQPPAPACALAVYMLAHQYQLESLERLAKSHILSHLTHSTCIPVFLASYRYSDLHERVLDYIHTEWKDVKHDGEFVRCFQEVARGVWGEEGGTILADMVARLPY